MFTNKTIVIKTFLFSFLAIVAVCFSISNQLNCKQKTFLLEEREDGEEPSNEEQIIAFDAVLSIFHITFFSISDAFLFVDQVEVTLEKSCKTKKVVVLYSYFQTLFRQYISPNAP